MLYLIASHPTVPPPINVNKLPSHISLTSNTYGLSAVERN
jgi:hypothetical protein